MDHLLAQEHSGAAVRGHETVGILGVGTHEDDHRPRQFLPDVPRQLDAVESGHGQVCDHEVRPLAVRDGQRLLPIGRFTDDPHVGRYCPEVYVDLAILSRVIDDENGQKNSPLLAGWPPSHACFIVKPTYIRAPAPATFIWRIWGTTRFPAEMTG